jgi:hypothetical protein
MEVGEALHNLRRHNEAIRNLQRAVDLQRVIAGASPERISNLGALSRTYTPLGGSLLGHGDQEGALLPFREGLSTADCMLSQAHRVSIINWTALTSWSCQRRIFDNAPETSRISGSERQNGKEDARSASTRAVISGAAGSTRMAVPYAVGRESRAVAALASLAQFVDSGPLLRNKSYVKRTEEIRT